MKNPILVAFGKHLRVIRKEKGVSQDNLAALSGIDRSYIGQIERGEKSISLLKIYQIAETLELPAHELIPR